MLMGVSISGLIMRVPQNPGRTLAIELAAAQSAYLTPKQIAALLDDALTTLASRIRGTPDRQATLAETVSWSFDLLGADERMLFPRLSVFAGGFTLDAAEAIASGDLHRRLPDVLATLVDKSLVLAGTLDNDQVRYRLHEFVRLQERPERALVAAVAAWRSWMASGMHAEGLQWLRRALAACPEVSAVQVRALFATAVFEVRLGRIEEAVPLGRAIADIGHRETDPIQRAEAAHLQCLLTWLAAEWQTIDRLLDAAEADLRNVPSVHAAHDHLRALVALSRGDSRGALPHLERSLHLLSATPNRAPPFFSVCTLAFSVGQYEGITMPIFEETMLVGRRVGVAQAEAYVSCTIAFAARAAERFSDAAEALDRARRIFSSLGDRAGAAVTLAQRGHLHRALGEVAAARLFSRVRRSQSCHPRPARLGDVADWNSTHRGRAR
jgi:hypothetical protein